MNAETRDKALEPRPLRHDDNPAPEDAELADLFRRVKPRGPLHELAVQRIRRGLMRTCPTANLCSPLSTGIVAGICEQ